MTDKNTWDNIAAGIWKYSQTPSRPHKSDIIFIENTLRNLRRNAKPKVLILGSTPEFRDICIKYNLIPTIVDYNKYNFEHLKKLMTRKGREILVKQDWRKMKISEKFDLILGDLSLNMVNFNDQINILKRLSKLLSGKGLIVHRTWLYKQSKYGSLRQLIQEHRHRRKINPYLSLLMELIHFWYDKKKRCITYQKTRDAWKKALEDNLITKKEFESYFRVYGYFNLPTYLTTKKSFELMVKKYFRIKSIFEGRYFNSQSSPIYVMGLR